MIDRIALTKAREEWDSMEMDDQGLEPEGKFVAAVDEILEADTIEMCLAHFHRGDLIGEEDYPLISYCPSEEFRGSCQVVTAVVVRVEGPND